MWLIKVGVHSLHLDSHTWASVQLKKNVRVHYWSLGHVVRMKGWARLSESIESQDFKLRAIFKVHQSRGIE